MRCNNYIFPLSVSIVRLGMINFTISYSHFTHILFIHYCDSKCETSHAQQTNKQKKTTHTQTTSPIRPPPSQQIKTTIWWVSNLCCLPPFMSTKLRSGTTHNHNDYRHNELIYYVLTTWYSGAYSRVMMSNNTTRKPICSDNHCLLWTIN